MLNRLYEMTGGRRGRNWQASAACLLSLLAVCFLGYAFVAGSAGEAASTALQLVRLNITADSGMVRIEITADGSLSEATIEQSTRRGETVIRIRGARSLLKGSYTIDDVLAKGVRTQSGEQGGEPFVDVLIARGEGSSVAQRVSFNRLVIAIAADFASLRRSRAPRAGGAEQARREQVKPRAAERDEGPAVRGDSVAKAEPGAASSLQTSHNAVVNGPTSGSPPAHVEQQMMAAATNDTALDFRSRRIWNGFPKFPSRLSRLNTRGILPMFLQTPAAALNTLTPLADSSLQIRLNAPGGATGVWVPGTTAAATDEIGGHLVGPGILRPSFLFGVHYDDNLFYRSGDGRHVTTFTVAPRLEYEIPGVERAMRVAYEARLRRLSLGQWANGHFLDFDARASLNSTFNVAFRNHFARSALDPQEYDPAGEVYIVGDTFTRNDAGARFEFALNDRTRMDFDLGYNIVRWDDRYIASAPLFLDYDILSSAMTVERDISPETTLLGSVFFDNTNTFVSKRPQFAGFNDNYRYGFLLGGRSQTSEAGGINMRVGYEQSEYRHAPKNNNLRTLIFDMAYRLNFRQNSSLELAALRKTQVSIFNLEGGNARLDTTGASARLENGPTESLKLGLTLNYQRLGYPLATVPATTASGGVFVGSFAGLRRAEHLYGFSVEASYRWSEILRGRLVYSFLRRDSTIPTFTFNRNRISLVFEWGRRNDTRGRPF
ncbi:MAG TPA: hypothetical protein VF544_03280 [Pyrinomonadaceae bacterium]